MVKKSIGNNIKYYRKNAGLTQAELVNIEAEQHGYYKKNAS